jgi:tetratricopeptide (TPR) repeat protein
MGEADHSGGQRLLPASEETRPRQGLFSLSHSPLLRALARREVQIGFALALLTVVAFAPVSACDYVNLDDPRYVIGNLSVTCGLNEDTIVWAFTTFYAANWHPLTWISLQLDVELSNNPWLGPVFGGMPGIFHRTNLILHVLNVILLYALLVWMTDQWPPAALVAALFAVHPLHVESVAWITERKDVLSTFFGLLALLAYLRYLRAPSVARYAILLLAYAASLAAKPMLVTLPCLLLLLDWWPLRRLSAGSEGRWPSATIRRLLMEKLPLFALALASMGITIYAQGQSQAIGTLERFPLGLRLANALHSTMTYLEQTFWPTGLAVYYPYPRSGVSPVPLAIDAVLLLGVTFLALRWLRSRPHVAVGWFWYLATLVPVIGLVQVGSQARADRYTYIPLIGVFVAVVWGLWEGLPRRRRLLGLSIVALLVLPTCMILTWTQIDYWRNSLALWEHTLAVTSDNPVAHTEYAFALVETGRDEEAVSHLEEAIRLYPRIDPAFVLLGQIHERHGRRKEAMACYRTAVELRPDRSYYRALLTRLEQRPP